MELLCGVLSTVVLVLAIQLGRVQTQLYFIRKCLEAIADNTSKEYRSN